MKNTYEYYIGPESIDFNGQASVASLYRLSIDAIAQNLRKEGYGLDVMAGMGRTWVLLRSALEVIRRPSMYTPVNVEVWGVPTGCISYSRCVNILDSDNNVIARANTEWCMLDISSRRPIQTRVEEDDVFLDLSCKGPRPRRIRDFEAEISTARTVRYSECDFNGHLNNSRYVDMLFDSLPEDLVSSRHPLRLDVNYKHEVRYGETLSLEGLRKSDSEYLFLARSQGQTACSAALETLSATS